MVIATVLELDLPTTLELDDSDVSLCVDWLVVCACDVELLLADDDDVFSATVELLLNDCDEVESDDELLLLSLDVLTVLDELLLDSDDREDDADDVDRLTVLELSLLLVLWLDVLRLDELLLLSDDVDTVLELLLLDSLDNDDEADDVERLTVELLEPLELL